MNKFDRLKFGDRLRQAREDAKFTQDDLADLIGIKNSAYSLVESGKNRLRIEHLPIIAEALGKPTAYFFDLDIGPLSAEEQEIIGIYRSLPREGFARKMFMHTLRAYPRSVQSALDPDDPSPSG